MTAETAGLIESLLTMEFDEHQDLQRALVKEAAAAFITSEASRMRMEEALTNIARQTLSADMDHDTFDLADFQGGYDTTVALARAALSSGGGDGEG